MSYGQSVWDTKQICYSEIPKKKRKYKYYWRQKITKSSFLFHLLRLFYLFIPCLCVGSGVYARMIRYKNERSKNTMYILCSMDGVAPWIFPLRGIANDWITDLIILLCCLWASFVAFAMWNWKIAAHRTRSCLCCLRVSHNHLVYIQSCISCFVANRQGKIREAIITINSSSVLFDTKWKNFTQILIKNS